MDIDPTLPRFGTDFPLGIEYLLYLLEDASWRGVQEAICLNELSTVNLYTQLT
jgi:hypothetical protein